MKLINIATFYQYHLDKKIQFHSGSDVISGVFKGLGKNGSAIIKTNQSEQEFHSGEVY